MKAGIFYASSHGSTEKVANYIKEKLGADNTTLFDLKKKKKFDLSEFDSVIIGGSIHAGKIQKQVAEFCSENLEILSEKKIALYLCCMMEDNAQKQFEESYPSDIRDLSVCNQIVGGEFVFERMNFIERAITKKVAKVKESVSKLDYNKIDILVDFVLKS